MKFRTAFTTLVLLAALTACGGADTGDTSASEETGPSAVIAGSGAGDVATSDVARSDVATSDAPTVSPLEPATPSSASEAGEIEEVTPSAVSAEAGASTGSDFCARMKAAEKGLPDLDSMVGGGDMGKLKSAIDAQVKTFQELGQGAPDDVQPALEDIVEVLQAGQQALANMASPDMAALQSIGVYLPNDLNALGNYAASNCYGG